MNVIKVYRADTYIGKGVILEIGIKKKMKKYWITMEDD